VVSQVQEVFADFYPVNQDLFTLNIPLTVGIMTQQFLKWNIYEQQMGNRITDALMSILLATRSKTVVRYQKSSDICYRFSASLTTRMQAESEFFTRMSQQSQEPTCLILLDRREDPVTPLLNQWTYQAMVHEVLGINNNRVDLKHLAHLGEDMKEVILSAEEDQFFKKIMYQDFGQVAESIHTLVQKFLSNRSSQAKFESIEDMQRVIENFPEFKKSERNTTKHFNILEELRKVIEGTRLYDVSEIEQELVAGNENKSGHYKMIEEIVLQEGQGSISKMEKLRLGLLFALRYENDDKVVKLKELLKSRGVSEKSVRLID